MEDVPERQKHICIVRTKTGIGQARAPPCSTSVSSCKMDTSAAMPSPICYQLRQICSSSPPLLLAWQGCQGAHMIPAGKTFPSRHKLGCPKQPQAAQLYN